MRGTPVEVRKNPQSKTWYTGTLLDVVGDNIRVSFEDSVWASREVPAYSVRRCPLEKPDDDFDPQVDEVVEVSVSASESNPPGWSLGRVKTIKTSFYFIGFVGNQKGTQDLIVERSALRSVNTEPAIDALKLQRKTVPVDPDLHAWIISQDSVGCLSHVQAKAGVLVSSCTHTTPNSKDAPEVLLIGEGRSVEVAEKLLTMIHFKNQLEMQRFHEHREQLMERLSELKSWYNSRHSETFAVDQTIVGKIIGKKGENIKLVRGKHGVEVHLKDVEASGQGRATATVTVTGSTAEAVKKAREELEYVTVKVKIESDQVGWILGKGYQNIAEIARKTDLHFARFDDKTSSLELCGLRQQVDDAKMLVSVHREYLPVYKDMDQERNAIEQSFDELDAYGPRKGKGKGKSKSKGGGGGMAALKDDDDGDRGKGKGKRGDRGGGRDDDDEGDKGKGRGKKGDRGGWRDDDDEGDKGKGKGKKGDRGGWRDDDDETDKAKGKGKKGDRGGGRDDDDGEKSKGKSGRGRGGGARGGDDDEDDKPKGKGKGGKGAREEEEEDEGGGDDSYPSLGRDGKRRNRGKKGSEK